MPRGNRTGPMGEGPRTGRGYGYCTGNDRPGYMQAGPGMGLGGGMGMRRGWGRGFRGFGGARRGFLGQRYGVGPWGEGWDEPMPAPTAGDDVSGLKAQAGFLQEQLDLIQARISELTDKTGEA